MTPVILLSKKTAFHYQIDKHQAYQYMICVSILSYRDAERMRKVKEIEHLLSNEQAEVNMLNRKKRKKW